ncbi:MAG TPA: hypothetical protein VHI52_14960, partial [Verrucomicrobiae bacterium]|nr:hypothetical protein [Verrucomicrobiae bacterium]
MGIAEPDWRQRSILGIEIGGKTSVKQFEWPFAVKFTLVLIAAFALSTWIDPYLSFHSPWANQAVNAVLPVLLMLFIWGLAGRAWVALVLEFVVLLVLRYVDHTKKMYLDVDLVYADFTVIGGLMKDPKLVLGFLHPTWAKFVRYALVVIVLAVAWWLLYRRLPAAWRRRRGMSWFPRLFCLVLAVLGTTVLLMTRAPDVIDRLNWQVYSQVNGSQSVGVAGNVLLGRMTERDKGPRPSRKAEQAFWNEPAVRAAEAGIQKEGNGQRPDIVIIQSEALFEPAQLCGFPDTPVLQRVAMEKPEG